jgi:anti-anti-sigma factor
MMVTMEFQMERQATVAGEARLVLSGELDLASGPRVQDELDRLREAGTAVTLDLSQLEFMDSAGLVAILSAVQAARRAKVSLVVERRLCPAVERLFSLTRTDDFLWPGEGRVEVGPS